MLESRKDEKSSFGRKISSGKMEGMEMSLLNLYRFSKG